MGKCILAGFFIYMKRRYCHCLSSCISYLSSERYSLTSEDRCVMIICASDTASLVLSNSSSRIFLEVRRCRFSCSKDLTLSLIIGTTSSISESRVYHIMIWLYQAVLISDPLAGTLNPPPPLIPPLNLCILHKASLYHLLHNLQHFSIWLDKGVIKLTTTKQTIHKDLVSVVPLECQSTQEWTILSSELEIWS